MGLGASGAKDVGFRGLGVQGSEVLGVIRI